MGFRAGVALCTALTVFAAGVAWAQGPSPLLRAHLVPVDGRQMNLVCEGSGAPVVVFEQGLGDSLLVWRKVFPAAAEITRVCAYDRAGYGLSAPAGRPMTALNVTRDLHELVAAAGVRTPLVLVGHSLGGLYATLYADRYPKDVAGLVLIDPTVAGYGVKPADPAEAANMAELSGRQVALQRRCEGLARAGALSPEHMQGCLQAEPGLSPEEERYLAQVQAKPFVHAAIVSEAESFIAPLPGHDVDSIQERRFARPFGEMPLIVMTPKGDGSKPPWMSEARAKVYGAAWQAGHDALARRSSRARSVTVTGSGHAIQLDRPEVVVQAIREVVEEARAQAR
jgi:pimeloyl-ACP methyl ester carboxylesterase